MYKPPLLLVFVKNIEPGQTKTRLASTMGDAAALAIYKGLLRYTISQLETLQVDKAVYYSRYIEKDDDWARAGFTQRLQEGEDLGERMANAFREGFEQGYERIAIIGSDCPELTPQILEQAFEALNSEKSVLGLAHDGGYYLLGLSEMAEEAFQEIEWSTESVGKDTLAALKKLGHQTQKLPTLSDVDYEEDWEQHKDRVLRFMG